MYFKEALQKHIRALYGNENSDGPWSVIAIDPHNLILDILGNSEIRAVLKTHAIKTGVRILETPTSSGIESAFAELPRGFRVSHAPVVLARENLIGVVTVVVADETSTWLLETFTKSIAAAVERELEAEWQLRDNAMLYQTLLSHLDYHVVRIGSDGRVRAYHPIPIQDDVHNQMLVHTERTPDGDIDLTLGDRLYTCVLRTLTHPTGLPAGRLGLFRDITDQRKIERRMRETDRISILASLAAGIAHEIRNPLTTAKGFLQLFAERQLSNPDHRYIDLTIQELDRIGRLVKDFMTLARPEPTRYQRIELNHLVQELIHFMMPEAMLHGVTMEFGTERSTIYVKGDPNQLKQVLMNILQNALQACSEHGKVDICTTQKSSSAVVSVRDTGVGLTKDQLGRVFQPFYTTKDSGTGLGLAICRQIMQEHGGSIEIYSQLGEGTTVTFQLPVVAPAPDLEIQNPRFQENPGPSQI